MTPQPGTFAVGTRSHHHLELDVHPSITADALGASLRVLFGSDALGGVNVVIGFGSGLWRTVSPPDQVPPDLADFSTIEGSGGKRAPATQHDLWIWMHGPSTDSVLDAAFAAADALADVGSVAHEQPCFVYRDSRDLTGFIDGTANPPMAEAHDVACIAEGRLGAGGSHVLTQRWVHDLEAFGSIPVSEQERVIGRAKADSTELEGDAKPADAHIARVELHDKSGDERPIFRRSTPYGTVGEHGLLFLAFSADRTRFDDMLANMFGTSGDGVRDRLLDFSRPVTGAYYFAPSVEALVALVS